MARSQLAPEKDQWLTQMEQGLEACLILMFDI